ncbi:hypothetical protein E2I00_003607, partial [Balaenoptera physalus]
SLREAAFWGLAPGVTSPIKIAVQRFLSRTVIASDAAGPDATSPTGHAHQPRVNTSTLDLESDDSGEMFQCLTGWGGRSQASRNIARMLRADAVMVSNCPCTLQGEDRKAVSAVEAFVTETFLLSFLDEINARTEKFLPALDITVKRKRTLGLVFNITDSFQSLAEVLGRGRTGLHAIISRASWKKEARHSSHVRRRDRMSEALARRVGCRSRAQEVDEDEKLVVFSALVADEKGSSKGAQLRQQFSSVGPTSSTYRCQLWVQLSFFPEFSNSEIEGHCLLHAWESTVLLAYPASRSLRPRWLCREPGLTSRPPVCSLFLSWGVPLVITVAAVTLKKIGYDASDVSVGWCWIDLEAEDRVLWMLLTGKAWEMLAYVTLPVLYLLIRKHINRAHFPASLRVLFRPAPALSLTPLPFSLPGDREHLSGGRQLHHVRPLHPHRPDPAPLSLLLLHLSAFCCHRREPGGPPRASAPSKTSESQGPRRAADELPSARAAPLLVLCLGAADLGQAALSSLCRERDVSCAVSLRLPKLLSPVGSSADSACLPPRPSSTSPSHRVLLHAGELVGVRAALSFRETRGS